MAIEYFCCYHSYARKLAKLSDQEVGRLFRALLKYSETGEAQELTGRESVAFDFIADDIDRWKKKSNSGKYHWNWKGGITPKNQVLRSSNGYKEWRNSVFKRDEYTCRICGKRGGRLNAHHIKMWSKFPELRFAVSNGVTLCEDCHKKIHKGETDDLH